MNKIYKTVLNKETGTYVAVSEISNGHGKNQSVSKVSFKKMASAALCTAGVLSLGGFSASALAPLLMRLIMFWVLVNSMMLRRLLKLQRHQVTLKQNVQRSWRGQALLIMTHR